MSSAQWREIRAMRADPPGLGTNEEGRRAVFSAALQQAEELHQAAEHTGYASRPLPLFYALSQGGRAIAAARAAKDWEIHAHGMRVETRSVLKSTLTPAPRGAVPTVAMATGCPAFAAPLELGQLLVTLPEVAELVCEHVEAAPAIALHRDATASQPQSYMQLTPPIDCSAIYYGPEGALSPAEQKRGLEERLAPYPRAHGWQIHSAWSTSGGRRGIGLSWPLSDQEGSRGFRELRSVSTPYRDRFYLRPGLGRDGGEISLLMSWWATLLGLSSLARYEPGLWRAGLDPDSSKIAAMLEAVLDAGQARVPELIAEALREA
jgi:YaaC-like Protein